MSEMRRLCALKQVGRQSLTGLPSDRERAILRNRTKWANGTVLHYYFFDRPTDGRNVELDGGSLEWRSWMSSDVEKDVVRGAFEHWKALGLGLDFAEVATREAAEIRIGFEAGDGAWSYVGRDILTIKPDQRTMNFGWPLSAEAREFDTALHEIGHTLGLPHEHQNPYAGIVWDEEAVYAALALPPNEWKRETTYHNILRKLDTAEVTGSNWDPDSIMHYPFEAGLIKEPQQYAAGLEPKGGLSARDKTYVLSFYPPNAANQFIDLTPLQPHRLALRSGEEVSLRIRPAKTAVYGIGSFGKSDLVMVLFEQRDGRFSYLAGDDDSAQSRNARLEVKLFQERTYILRVRLFYAESDADVAVMLWLP
jgi:hypothetical protein